MCLAFWYSSHTICLLKLTSGHRHKRERGCNTKIVAEKGTLGQWRRKRFGEKDEEENHVNVKASRSEQKVDLKEVISLLIEISQHIS